MASSVKSMGLTSLDDLFMSDMERQDSREKILTILLTKSTPTPGSRIPLSVLRPIWCG